MKSRFHPNARVEYVEALEYLEERRPGYGEKFEAEVYAVAHQHREPGYWRNRLK